MTRPSLMGETMTDLPIGPIGRWDRGTQIEIKLFSGALFGLPDEDVLAGGNRLALKTEKGWEVMQFARADLLAEGHYRLSGLLRGQFGTDNAMMETLPAHAICVLLGPHMQALPDVAGGQLTMRYGIAGLPEDGYSWRARNVDLHHAALACLAPVHGKLRMPEGPKGSWHMSWVRRARQGGDNFDAPDIPLGEPQELYQTEIWAGAQIVSSRRQATASLSLSAKSRRKLAGGQNRKAAWHLRVAQINAHGAPGAALTLNLPSFSKG